MPISYFNASQIIKELQSGAVDSKIENVDLLNLKTKIAQLKDLYSQLDKYRVLSEQQQQQRSKRLGQLDQSISTRFFSLDQETSDIEQIEQTLTKMYFLTEEILADLQLITKPNYSIVYSDSSQGVYARSPNGQLALSQGSFLEYHRGAWTLRFQSSLQQIAQSKNAVRKQQFYDAQYEKFVNIIKNHLGELKPNEGHLVEAYERYKESKKTKMYESTVIKYYWQSTGRDPYYTGPDTKLSQVKAQNATITSVNTILYTTQAILAFASTATPTEKQLKDAFCQTDVIAHNQLKQVLEREGLPKSVSKMLIKNFGKYLKLNS